MEVVLLLILWTACAAFAGWIAKEKGKPFEGSIVIGALFGPLGVLYVLLMAGNAPKPPAAPYGPCSICRMAPAARETGGLYCNACAATVTPKRP